MLSADQITSIRSAAGAAPLQGNGVAPTSLSDRLGLNTPADPGYTGRVQESMAAGAQTTGQGFKTAATNIGSDFNSYAKSNEGANLPEQVLHGLVFLGHTAGNIAGAAGHVLAGSTQAGAAPFTAIKSTTGGGTLGDAMNKNLAQPLGAYISQGVQNVKAAHPGLVDFLHKNPDITKGLMDLFNTVGLAGGGETGLASKIPAVSDAANALKTTATDAATALPKVVGDVRMSSTAAETAAAPKGLGMVENFQASRGNANNRGLAIPAQRLADKAPLIGAGAAREAKMSDVYEQAVNDSNAHLDDPTGRDKPIEAFGQNEVSNAFDQVVKQRKDAGAAMGAELEKPEVGGIKTNVTEAKQGVINELTKQKLNYDPAQKKIVSLGGQSPMGNGDRNMLETYINDLGTLDNKPTVSDVNNFIQRTNADLDLYKAKNQITGTTNGERIIKDNLAKLRETISAEKTGNPALKPYSDAKAEFARLSPTVEHGVSLLGKPDLEGGYIRDASIAKRAVQSITNGGTKDFMRSLEKETGRPLLDHAYVILQAMKDTGDTSAHSLLDMFGKDAAAGIVPSADTIRGKLMQVLTKHTVDAVAGSPVEQTRAFLKQIEESRPKGKAGAPSTLSTKDLVANATAYQPRFKTTIDHIAEIGGWEVKHGPVKTADRLDQKIAQEGGSPDRMRDANRSTILVQDSSELASVLAAVKEKFDVTRVKDKFNVPGYKSAIINVKTPLGHEAEIAVTTPKMWNARMELGGDSLYKQVRIKAQGWEEAEQKMHQLYEAASKR